MQTPTVPALTPDQAIELIREYGEVVSLNAFRDRYPEREHMAAQKLFEALTGQSATPEQLEEIKG